MSDESYSSFSACSSIKGSEKTEMEKLSTAFQEVDSALEDLSKNAIKYTPAEFMEKMNKIVDNVSLKTRTFFKTKKNEENKESNEISGFCKEDLNMYFIPGEEFKKDDLSIYTNLYYISYFQQKISQLEKEEEEYEDIFSKDGGKVYMTNYYQIFSHLLGSQSNDIEELIKDFDKMTD